MAGGDVQADPVAGDDLAGQQRLVDRALDEGKIGLAVQHQRHSLRGVADRELEMDGGMIGGEPGHPARQPVGRDRLARGEPHLAPRQPGEVVENTARLFQAGDHRPRLGQEHLAGRGQLEMAAHPVEQPRRLPLLERRDRSAHRRLRQMKPLGRPRHAERLGDDDEGVELLEGHSINSIY